MLQPIPTRYRGCQFLSRLEARWAVFFDALDLEWDYEPEGFILPSGECYLPDFYLPQVRMYAEVKPCECRDEVVVPPDARRKLCDLAQAIGRPVILCDGTPRDTNYWTAWPQPGEDYPTWEDVVFTDLHRYHLVEGRLFASTGGGLFRHDWPHEDCNHPAVAAARSARFEHGARV